MKFLLALLTLAGVLTGHAAGPAPPSFVKVTPAGEPNFYTGIAYGSNRFVIVGRSGIIFSEDDGQSWRFAKSPSNTNFNAVRFLQGAFYALGAEGIFSSKDGSLWTRPQIAGNLIPTNLTDIAYGDGKFVVSGDTGLFSTNGTFFESTGFGGGYLAYGDGRFLSLNSSGTLSFSSDGRNWTQVSHNIPLFRDPNCTNNETCFRRINLSGVTYWSGRFLAHATYLQLYSFPTYSSSLYGTTNGTNWAHYKEAPAQIFSPVSNDIINFDGRIAITGSPFGFGSVRSTTVLSSTNELSIAGPDTFRGIAKNQSTWIAIGASGTDAGAGIWRSTNSIPSQAENWTAQIHPKETLRDIVASGSTIAAVSSRILISTNGLASLRIAEIPTGTPPLNAISSGNGAFVAVGQAGAILRSFNGVNWSRRVSNTSHEFHDVAHGAGIWVAVGDNGKVVTSPDASAFSLRFSSTELHLRGIVYGGGQFVAVGQGGAIIASPEGTNWTSFGDEAIDLWSVAYGNGKYVAIGTNGTVRISPDGYNWQSAKISMVGGPSKIAFGHGYFVMSNSPYRYSPDGIVWFAGELPDSVIGVKFTDGDLWLTGFNASIWRTTLGPGSMPHLSLSLAQDRTLVLNIFAPIAGDYFIETKPSLSSEERWETITTLTNIFQNTPWTFGSITDPNAAFFRARKK